MKSWTRPPKLFRKIFPSSIWKCWLSQDVLFSFDDGPGPHTNALLDLSLEDGAATLTEYTSEFLYRRLRDLNIYPQNAMRREDNIFNNIIMCGGGRKNIFLIKSIEKKIRKKIKLIDDFGINGDFVESQAFAYLAIRSYLKIPISFPSTTGVSKPCTGGTIIEN